MLTRDQGAVVDHRPALLPQGGGHDRPLPPRDFSGLKKNARLIKL